MTDEQGSAFDAVAEVRVLVQLLAKFVVIMHVLCAHYNLNASVHIHPHAFHLTTVMLQSLTFHFTLFSPHFFPSFSQSSQ
jgi:hypothetical protein